MLEKVLANGGSQIGELVQTEVKNVGIFTFVYSQDVDGNIIKLQYWKS